MDAETFRQIMLPMISEGYPATFPYLKRALPGIAEDLTLGKSVVKYFDSNTVGISFGGHEAYTLVQQTTPVLVFLTAAYNVLTKIWPTILIEKKPSSITAIVKAGTDLGLSERDALRLAQRALEFKKEAMQQ